MNVSAPCFGKDRIQLCALMQNYGIQLGTDMCKRMLAEGTPGLHLYTLNLERSAIAILKNLSLVPKQVSCMTPFVGSAR